MNNDNPSDLYSSNQRKADEILLDQYESVFSNYKSIKEWGKPGTINAGVELVEKYNSPSSTRNAFYIHLKTQEYLFQKDINSPAYSPISGFKITDLIRKPNGNMDADPIDWTKADIVFTLAITNSNSMFNLNGKEVNILVFVDLDSKTYAAFARNSEDDPVNGPDKGRQTLLTTSWQPLSKLFKGWDL